MFSPLKGAEFGETWPLLEKTYPADLTTISANQKTDIKPQNLAQLNQLREMEFNTDTQKVDQQVGKQEEFMFESRSLHVQPTVVVQPVPLADKDSDTGESLEFLDPGVANKTPESNPNLQLIEQLLYPQKPEAFEQLSSDDYFLGDLARSLRRSSGYRFLTHMAWRQPIRASDAPTPILIQTGDHFDDNFMIDGTLAISRSRYLHVNTDLWFTQFTPKYGPGSSSDTIVNIDEETRTHYPDIAKWEQLRDQQIPIQSYPLQQSRRMRSATLHYIDHPLFGILIQINRYRGDQDSS